MAKKCICFSRVSSYRQDLEYQRNEVKTEALKTYKLSEIIEVTGKESAIKLSEEQRQTLNEMKSIVEDNPTIDSIYFFAVDRLARRVSVVMSIKEWADDHNINLVFLNPVKFNTLDKQPDGSYRKNTIADMFLNFLSIGAKMEMEMKNERFRSAKQMLKQQNKPISRMLFGYSKNEDKTVRIDPNTGRIIKWVFDSYLHNNKSTSQIYAEGVELGYWSKLNARSSQANRIRVILSNYAYAGENTGRDLVYPAIVDRTDVETAIQMLSEAQNKPKCKSKHSYLCKSIIKDKNTGYTMKADISHIRYMSITGDEKLFTISMNICDTCIWRSAYQAKWISLSTTDSDTIGKTKDQLSEISVKISNLNDIISDIDRRTEKAYTAFVSGKGRITPELYEKTLRGLENERTETISKVHKYEKREAELFNLLNELQTKEKRDIEIRSVSEITDDTQRIEIIKEVVRGMTVEKKNKRFIIEVDTILPVSDRYLYTPKGRVKKLYYINGEFDPFDVDIEKAVEQQILLDITSEIMIRFKLKK